MLGRAERLADVGVEQVVRHRAVRGHGARGT